MCFALPSVFPGEECDGCLCVPWPGNKVVQDTVLAKFARQMLFGHSGQREQRNARIGSRLLLQLAEGLLEHSTY